MKSNIKSYEEQVLELGNGKMLEPGCYDENMKRICSIETVDDSYQPKICDRVHYVVFNKDMAIVPDYFAYSFTNLEQVILSDKTKRIGNHAFGRCLDLKKDYIFRRLVIHWSRSFCSHRFIISVFTG